MQVEKNLCLLTPRAEGRNLLLGVVFIRTHNVLNTQLSD